jgi:hypothetical protein
MSRQGDRMRRYVYSLVRCVPDPQTGEFINVGAIVGDPDSGDWSMRQVSNESRVRRLSGPAQLDAVHQFLTEIGIKLDDARSLMENEGTNGMLDAGWLESLHHNYRNVVQLSVPTPMAAESAEQALDFLFAGQVIDPQLQSREAIVTKWTVISDMRKAYRRAAVADQFIHQKAELYVGAHLHTPLDFAVIAGQTLQITQGWSFRRAEIDELSTQIKAWAFPIGRLRAEDDARVISAGETVSGIPRDVDVQVVVAEPKSGQQIRAYEEASQVFAQVGASVRTLDEADDVGRHAADLVAKAGFGYGGLFRRR